MMIFSKSKLRRFEDDLVKQAVELGKWLRVRYIVLMCVYLFCMFLFEFFCTSKRFPLTDDRKGFIQGLTLTVILGFFFTLLQAYEYHHATFNYSGHIYGAVFYMSTGFHGFHVIVGTIFLAVCLWRGKLGHFTKDHHFGFEAAAWYWHFVDVVWLFLFAAIYIWGS